MVFETKYYTKIEKKLKYKKENYFQKAKTLVSQRFVINRPGVVF